MGVIENRIDILELERSGGGGGTAASVSYDNTSSHMTATDVQAALDELNLDIVEGLALVNTSVAANSEAILGLEGDLSGTLSYVEYNQEDAITGITGTSTLQETATALLASLNTTLSGLSSDESMEIVGVRLTGVGFFRSNDVKQYRNNETVDHVYANAVAVGGTSTYVRYLSMSNDAAASEIIFTYADDTATSRAIAGTDAISSLYASGISVVYNVLKDM